MAQVLPQVLAQALVRYGRDNVASLKLLEPVILEKLPRMSPSMITDVFVAYSKQQCGSRAFWESVLAAATSEHAMNFSPSGDEAVSSTSAIIRMLDCVNASPTFYKPTYLLSELYPRIVLNELNIADLRSVLLAYSKYPKSVGSGGDFRHLVDRIVHRVTVLNSTDFESLGSILSSVNQLRLYSPEIETFAQYIESIGCSRLSEAEKMASPTDLEDCAIPFYQISVGLYRLSVRFKRPLNGAVVVGLMQKIDSSKLGPAQVCTLSILSANLFGLMNTFKFNPINLGPEFFSFFKNRVSSSLSKTMAADVRELARLTEAMAQVRWGSSSFWASIVGRWEKTDLETLSPEELSGLAFAVFEMNLPQLGERVLVSVFEKINLFTSSSLINPVLPLALELGGIDRLLQFIDQPDADSEDPSVVLAQMAFLGLGSPLAAPQYLEYQMSCRSVIDGAVFAEIKDSLTSMFPGVEIKKQFLLTENVLVDFFLPDLAVLVSSPLHVFNGTVATGTARLRHAIVKARLPPDCALVNVSAEEWVAAASLAEKSALLMQTQNDQMGDNKDNKVGNDKIRDSQMENNQVGNDNIRDSQMENNQVGNKKMRDRGDKKLRGNVRLNQFVRADRNAAHKNRAPPSTALPWVSTVLTLKH